MKKLSPRPSINSIILNFITHVYFLCRICVTTHHPHPSLKYFHLQNKKMDQQKKEIKDYFRCRMFLLFFVKQECKIVDKYVDTYFNTRTEFIYCNNFECPTTKWSDNLLIVIWFLLFCTSIHPSIRDSIGHCS